MSWRGVFSGALMLIALQAVVATNKSASRVGELLESVGGLVRSAMSPAVPALPDLAGAGSSGGGGFSGGGGDNGWGGGGGSDGGGGSF